MDELMSFQAFLDAIGQRESTDNYQLVNGAFVGRYQLTEFVVASFRGTTIYRDDDLNDGVFDGVFTGARGINSLQDFLDAEALQDEVFTDRVQVIGEELIAAGVDAYAGSTIDGIALTFSSLVAGTQLVGQPAVERYFASNKQNPPSDGFGTLVTEYFELFSGFDVPVERSEDGSDEASRLIGSNAADTLLGAGGDDTLEGRGGIDTAAFRASADNYTVSRAPSGAVIVEQTGSAAADDGRDTLLSIERLAFSDRTVAVSSLDLANGASVTFAPGGDDDLPDDVGTGGNDGDPNAPPVERVGTAASERVGGGGGNDTLLGEGGNDTVSGFGGNDLLRGGDGADQLNGGGGDDIMESGTGADLLRGGAGNDLLCGGSDDDQLIGGTGDDTLDGWQDDDLVLGGAGDDTLSGGTTEVAKANRAGRSGSDGDDTLEGGAGEDVFRFLGNFGNDVVRGYTAADDRLELGALPGITRASQIELEAVGGGVRLSANDQSVLVTDVSLDDLRGEIFIV